MSLATFKKKTQAKYHNNSVNELQFSTVGPYRNQGRVGQSTQSRSLTGPNSNGTTLCSKNDNTVVKKASMNTNGMLLSRYRWLRRPYDAAQPLNSISLKPGAGNILYGSQDAYIERKRKAAVCCDNSSALTTIISKIIDTPLLDVFQSALGNTSLSNNNVDSSLNAAGYGIATGSGADYNQMGGDYLSDPTIALIKDLIAKLSGGTVISDTEKVRSNNSITLSANTNTNSNKHIITSTNVKLMKRATTFNNTKNTVLSTGTSFLTTIIGIKQEGQAAQMAAAAAAGTTLPNLYGIQTAGESIEQVGALSTIVSQTKDADGIPTDLTDAQLRVLTLVIYSIDANTGVVGFNTNNSADAIDKGYTNPIPQLVSDSQLGSLYFPSANNYYDRNNWTSIQKVAMTKFFELKAKMQLIRSYQRFINFPTTVNFTGGASGYINLINDFRNGLSNNADNLTTLITLFFTIYNARTSITVNGTPLSTPMSYAELNLLSQYLSPYTSGFTNLKYTVGSSSTTITVDASNLVSTFIQILTEYHNIINDNTIGDDALIFAYTSDIQGFGASKGSVITTINEFIVMNFSVSISDVVYETIALNQTTSLQASLTNFSSNWKSLYTATQNIVNDVNNMSEKPESIISLGDIVSIGDQYFVITGINEDLTVQNLTTYTGASQTIPLGTNVNLITLSDDNGNRTIQTGVTTTTVKGCCLLDIDKAFLDQNNQQKRCGSTNTCG